MQQNLMYIICVDLLIFVCGSETFSIGGVFSCVCSSSHFDPLHEFSFAFIALKILINQNRKNGKSVGMPSRRFNKNFRPQNVQLNLSGNQVFENFISATTPNSGMSNILLTENRSMQYSERQCTLYSIHSDWIISTNTRTRSLSLSFSHVDSSQRYFYFTRLQNRLPNLGTKSLFSSPIVFDSSGKFQNNQEHITSKCFN